MGSRDHYFQYYGFTDILHHRMDDESMERAFVRKSEKPVDSGSNPAVPTIHFSLYKLI